MIHIEREQRDREGGRDRGGKAGGCDKGGGDGGDNGGGRVRAKWKCGGMAILTRGGWCRWLGGTEAARWQPTVGEKMVRWCSGGRGRKVG